MVLPSWRVTVPVSVRESLRNLGGWGLRGGILIPFVALGVLIVLEERPCPFLFLVVIVAVVVVAIVGRSGGGGGCFRGDVVVDVEVEVGEGNLRPMSEEWGADAVVIVVIKGRRMGRRRRPAAEDKRDGANTKGRGTATEKMQEEIGLETVCVM